MGYSLIDMWLLNSTGVMAGSLLGVVVGMVLGYMVCMWGGYGDDIW